MMDGTAIAQNGSLTGSVVSNGVLTGRVIAPTVIPYEFFDGDYAVTPKTTNQVLETQLKSMSDNIQINAIPYFQVSNQQGGSTIIIGGNE